MTEPFPRVTRILADVGLGPDFSRVPPADLEIARDRGNAVHAAIEALAYGYFEGEPDPAIAAYLDAYRKFIHESRYVTLASEFEVVHPAWRYQGHPDSLGLIGTTRVILDYKTGELGAVDYQLVAYVEARNAMHPTEPVTAGIAVQLRDDGAYRIHEADLNAARPVWYAAVTVYYAKRTP